ncbi:unnamed protein product [Ectocarpus sp. 13 AM-2016]
MYVPKVEHVRCIRKRSGHQNQQALDSSRQGLRFPRSCVGCSRKHKVSDIRPGTSRACPFCALGVASDAVPQHCCPRNRTRDPSLAYPYPTEHITSWLFC